VADCSQDRLEVDALREYVEESLLSLVMDIRQAHTTLRADHDFVVTQVRAREGGILSACW
jgi:hypothetical protein